MSKQAVSDRIDKMVFALSVVLASSMMILSIGAPSPSAISLDKYACQEFVCESSDCHKTAAFSSPVDETNEMPTNEGARRTVVCEQKG